MVFFLLASFAIFTSSGRAVYKQQNHVVSLRDTYSIAKAQSASVFSSSYIYLSITWTGRQRRLIDGHQYHPEISAQAAS
jgi:uncharacterized protein YxjI